MEGFSSPSFILLDELEFFRQAQKIKTRREETGPDFQHSRHFLVCLLFSDEEQNVNS